MYVCILFMNVLEVYLTIFEGPRFTRRGYSSFQKVQQIFQFSRWKEYIIRYKIGVDLNQDYIQLVKRTRVHVTTTDSAIYKLNSIARVTAVYDSMVVKSHPCILCVVSCVEMSTGQFLYLPIVAFK